MAFNHAVFAIDGYARKVAHMLVRARQLVEKCRLAAVLLSGESESQLRAFEKRRFVRLVVVDARFAQARVGVMVGKGSDIELVIILKIIVFRVFGSTAWFYLNQGGIGFAQGECVAVNHHLHRVAEGSEFHQFNDRIGDEAHVQKVLSALAFSIN